MRNRRPKAQAEQTAEPVAPAKPGRREDMLGVESALEGLVDRAAEAGKRMTDDQRTEFVQEILQITIIEDLLDEVDEHRSARERAARHRCDKCGTQMLPTQSICQACEVQRLTERLAVIRTVLSVGHNTLYRALKREPDPAQPKDPQALAVGVVGAFYLLQATLAEFPSPTRTEPQAQRDGAPRKP